MLDASKAIQQNDIPVKIIKVNRDIFSEFIMQNFNESISTTRFPDIRSAEVKAVFFKKTRITKENYRLVSILHIISKIFERLIFKQLMFFQPVFSKYQLGFRNGPSAQHCLLAMTEGWKEMSRYESCMWSHINRFVKDIWRLRAKLHAYGFD